MNKSCKRAFTGAVAVLTILWSVGIAAYVPKAHAAEAGDLIKGTTLSTVYYYGSDGSRYAFPNEKTFFTWYEDFSDVETISDSALAAITLAGNIVYRPGSHWIKIESDPKTYAVTAEGAIRWIETEEAAEGLAGTDWNAFIDDVSDTFFVDYTVGTSLTSATDAYEGALVADGSDTYLVWGGEKLLVSDDGFEANGFQTRFVLDGDSVDLSGLTAGDGLDAEDSELTDTAQLGGETEEAGGLSVSVASDTAAAATLPAGAASVPFATFKLVATDGDVTVEQMIVKLGGIGDVNNLPDVYLYEGNTRLTDGRSINTSTRTVTYSSLDLLVEDGGTTYVTARADIAADPTAGDTAYLYLLDEDSVVTDGTISGSFPVAGNTMTFSDTPAGEVDIDESGTISDPTVGSEDAIIAKFTIAAEDEDATIERIALTIDNASDHSDYKLTNDGETIAVGEEGDDDLVTFTLIDEMIIEDGDDELFKVSADIGGESDDNITVAIDEEADVSAIGGDFGFNLNVDIVDYDEPGAACAGAADDCSFSTILGGELTFAFNGPSSDDIEVDGKDVVFMEFTLTSENWTEIKDFDVIVEDDGEDDDDNDDTGLKQTDEDVNLADICIRESDGSIWMGPEEISGDDADSDQTQTLTFTDDQVMNAGDSLDLTITADIDANAPAAEVWHVEIDMSTVTAEDSNGDELAAADIVPTADIVGHDFTTVASALNVTVSTPPSDGATYVKGGSSISVVGFSFEAGAASDVNISELTLSSQGDGDGAFAAGDIATPDTDLETGDFISSCSLYDNATGSLVDGPESPDDDEQFAFTSFDWTIEAGETDKLLVKCNFSNTDTNGGTDDAYVFFIDAAADITAEDEDGDEIDADLDDGNGDDDAGDVDVIITNNGEIAVVIAGDSADSTIILGSSTGVSVSKYKFTATDEAFVVEQVTLYNCDEYNADGDCADAGEAAGSDDVSSSVTVSYVNSDGETETKSGYLAANFVTFDNMDMYVPTTENRYLTVTIATNSVSATGADSGDVIQLNFETEHADGEFEAVGQSSGETIDEDDAADPDSVAANDMVIRKTKPTISLASGSPSGASIPGLAEVLRFNVAADSRGYVELNTMTFDLSISTDALNTWDDCDATELGADANFILYNYDDMTTAIDDDWAYYDAQGADLGECTNGQNLSAATVTFAADEEIGAGSTETYVLKIDTTGAEAADDDAIRIDILDQTTAEAIDTSADPDGVNWDDDDDPTGVGLEGLFVKNLPVNGNTITY